MKKRMYLILATTTLLIGIFIGGWLTRTQPVSAAPKQEPQVSNTVVGISVYYPDRSMLYIYEIGALGANTSRCISYRLNLAQPAMLPVAQSCK